MPTASRLRQAQRDEIHPLIRTLIERFGNARSYMDIAHTTGLANYQVGRLLGEALPSPTYLDITKLVIAAGMTPNEAASIVGLYHGPDYDRGAETMLSPDEQRLITLLRSVKLPEEERGLFYRMIETMFEAFAERLSVTTRKAAQIAASASVSSPSLYDGEEARDLPHWERMEVDRRAKRGKRVSGS